MLKKLRGIREGAQEEFKQRVSNLNKIAKALVAFANSRGGRLWVGIADDRSTAGIDPEEEMFLLNDAAQHYCRPPVTVRYEVIDDDEAEKTVLLVHVPQSAHKPHYALHKNGEWQAYVRHQDQSVPAGPTLEKQMAMEEAGEALPPYTPKDKTEKKLYDYLQRHPKITVSQFMKLANISERRARRLLTELMRHGHLRVLEHEKEAAYTL